MLVLGSVTKIFQMVVKDGDLPNICTKFKQIHQLNKSKISSPSSTSRELAWTHKSGQ